MKFVRKNKLDEGMFRNPEQAKAHRERMSTVSNAEKLAKTTTDSIIIPKFRQFLCENMLLRYDFNSVITTYLRANQWNDVTFSDLDTPKFSGSSLHIGDMFVEPIVFQPKSTGHDDKLLAYQQMFVITNIDIVNKNISAGQVTVDINGVMTFEQKGLTKQGLSAERMGQTINLFTSFQLGSAATFRGKPGSEGTIRDELSRELTKAYKNAIKYIVSEMEKAPPKISVKYKEEDIFPLQEIKKININKIYMYRAVPDTIVSRDPYGEFVSQTVDYAGNGGSRIKNGKAGAFIGFPIYNDKHKESYSDKELAPGELEIATLDENILTNNYGGALDVFDFNKSDIQFHVHGLISGLYRASDKVVKGIYEYIRYMEYLNHDDIYENWPRFFHLLNELCPRTKLSSLSNIKLLLSFAGHVEYVLKDNKLVLSDHSKIISKVIGATDNDLTGIRTALANSMGKSKSESLISFAETGYDGVHVYLHRMFLTTLTPSMKALSDIKFTSYSASTDDLVLLYPTYWYNSSSYTGDHPAVCVYNRSTFTSLRHIRTLMTSISFFDGNDTFLMSNRETNLHSDEWEFYMKYEDAMKFCQFEITKELVKSYEKILNAIAQ